LAYLKAAAAPWNGLSTLLIILIIALVVAFVGFAIWKRPSAAAPVGATAIAMAVVENAVHLSPVGGSHLWRVVYILLIVGLVVTAAGVVRIFLLMKSGKNNEPQKISRENQGGLGTALLQRLRHFFFTLISGDPKAPTELPLLTLGFSLLVLVWALVLVAHRTDTITSQPDSSSYVSERPPLPAVTFKSESDPMVPDMDTLDELKRQIGDQKPEEGDMLLLIGSADCARIRSSKELPSTNGQLAKRRAERVQHSLEDAGLGTKNGLSIKANYLPQYDSCMPTSELRAVFPFLFRSRISTSEGRK
jgi:flagellar basal body-associated protein FliL